MSLYACIDLIDSQLKNLNNEKQSMVDQEFLNNLREQLNKRITDDNYTTFSADIKLIENYLSENQHTKIKNCLKLIVDDLKEIARMIGVNTREALRPKVRANELNANSPDYDYKKFQTPEYLIASINQAELVKMGTSSGECYGFTYAMANPNLSPYKNPGMGIDLNQDVHNYQKFQSNREKDQQSIKRTRITRKHFCPDAQQQARQILSIAERNKGKELFLHRRCAAGGHACYLSVQDDGQIRYMDPNYGAFLFHHAQDFIDFYVAAARASKEAGLDYRFYSLAEIKYDEKEQLTETKTWQGKIRTLLTGPKYGDSEVSDTVSFFLTLGFYMALGGSVGWVVGSILGAAIGSVIPILGTAMGAELGMSLGGMLGGLAGEILSIRAYFKGCYGLLGIPHMFQDDWHHFKEKHLSSVAFFSKTNDSRAVASNECSINCSTLTILSLLDVDSLPQQPVFSEEVIRSVERHHNRVISAVIAPEPIDNASSTISISF